MIALEAALAGGGRRTGSGNTVSGSCSCGQEIEDQAREHCPRCGCCLK